MIALRCQLVLQRYNILWCNIYFSAAKRSYIARLRPTSIVIYLLFTAKHLYSLQYPLASRRCKVVPLQCVVVHRESSLSDAMQGCGAADPRAILPFKVARCNADRQGRGSMRSAAEED